MNTIKKLRFIDGFKIVTVLLLIWVCLLSSTSLVFGDDKDDTDYSFYRVSSALAAHYESTHNANNPDYTNEGLWNSINGGTAGAFLGFIDRDYDKTTFGISFSSLSSSSQSHGYWSYNGNTTEEKALKEYITYGHALYQLGLDSTASPGLLSGITRMIAGYLMMLFYALAISVDAIFETVLTLLQILNPFAWFIKSDSMISIAGLDMPGFANESSAQSLDSLAVFVSSLYDFLYSLAWILIPVFLAVLIFSLIMVRRGESAGSRVRKYITRVVFIVLGVPFLGASYTAALDVMIDGFTADEGAPTANLILASTFVDFESWASNNHLALPGNTTIVVRLDSFGGGQVDIAQSTPVRELARSINISSGTSLGLSSEDIQVNDFNFASVSEINNTNYSQSVGDAFNLLNRYTSDSRYTASSFETEYKSRITNPEAKALMLESIRLWSDINGAESCKVFDWFCSDVDPNPEDVKELVRQSRFLSNGGNSASIYGTLDNNMMVFKLRSDTTGTACVLSPFVCGREISASGMSPLSMYNYLTTTFGDDAVIVYSPNKAFSAFAFQSHQSVSLIGTGLTGILYYLNSLTLLASLTIIGWGYAITMLMSTLKRSGKVISSLPMAMLGSLRGMARFATIIVMMIIGIMGTFFVYTLVEVLIMALNTMVESIMVSSLGSVFPSGGEVLVTISLILAIIVNITFIITAFRLRHSTIKTLDETFAGWIDRIFGTEGQGGAGAAMNTATGEQSKPSLAKKVVGGVVAAGVMSKIVNSANQDNSKKEQTTAGSVSDKPYMEGQDAQSQEIEGKRLLANNATSVVPKSDNGKPMASSNSNPEPGPKDGGSPSGEAKALNESSPSRKLLQSQDERNSSTPSVTSEEKQSGNSARQQQLAGAAMTVAGAVLEDETLGAIGTSQMVQGSMNKPRQVKSLNSKDSVREQDKRVAKPNEKKTRKVKGSTVSSQSKQSSQSSSKTSRRGLKKK